MSQRCRGYDVLSSEVEMGSRRKIMAFTTSPIRLIYNQHHLIHRWGHSHVANPMPNPVAGFERLDFVGKLIFFSSTCQKLNRDLDSFFALGGVAPVRPRTPPRFATLAVPPLRDITHALSATKTWIYGERKQAKTKAKTSKASISRKEKNKPTKKTARKKPLASTKTANRKKKASS